MTAQPEPRNPGLSAFRFDTGRRCLDFVGTVGHRPAEHVERLDSAERLVSWLEHVGLPRPTDRLGDRDLGRAVALREALCAVLDAAVDEAVPAPTAVDVVNAAAAHAPPKPRLDIGPGARIEVTHEPPVPLDALLAVIARETLGLVADDELRAKLRRCAAGDCRKIFLDSAPRPRRWCSRQYCGTRSRVAAHRARTDGSAG